MKMVTLSGDSNEIIGPGLVAVNGIAQTFTLMDGCQLSFDCIWVVS